VERGVCGGRGWDGGDGVSLRRDGEEGGRERERERERERGGMVRRDGEDRPSSGRERG
jgi:hypothetical protein